MNHPLPPSASSLPLALKPLRVLYADDVKQLRELMSLIMKREGHGVETVENGAEALACLTASSDYDLLITDHHMPKLNGLDLVRSIRAKDEFTGKIIVFSSELSPLVHDDYRALNVDLILAKPVFPLTFRLLLRQIFAANYPAPVETAVPII